LLLFLYNSGARVSEAASLRIGDIDWHARSVRIMGKGSKERRCPLWANTIEHLRRLVDKRPHDAHVFLNRRGEPITRYGVHTMIERYITKLRATTPLLRGKRFSPHVIRHSTATQLLQAGVDINTIRAWLGHVSLDTTSIYAETDLATKKRALATLDCGRTRKMAGGWARGGPMSWSSCARCSLEDMWRRMSRFPRELRRGSVLRHILVCATYW